MNTFDTSAFKCLLLTSVISPDGFRWFEVIRCCLCGSRGTHRKCSGLKVDTIDWACSDCINATDGKGLTWQVCGLFVGKIIQLMVFSTAASLVASPQGGQKRSLLSKRHLSPMPSPIGYKR